MYIETPNVPGTTESRIAALKESKELLKGDPEVTTGSIFGGGATKPSQQGNALDLIRLSTYIETGHDYLDLHVDGKRRPIIRNTTVHVHTGGDVPTPEDLEHFLHHVENGDFADFLKDMMAQPVPADDEKSADEDPSPEADPDRDSDTPPPAHPWGN